MSSRAAAATAPDDIIIQAESLVRSFGPVQAVRGLSLQIRRGELYGLIGPDGAGKTTAIRMIAGLIVPDSGRALVLGEDSLRGGLAVREHMGLMPQQYSLYGDLSIAENLRFFGHLFCLPRQVFEERSQRLLKITRLDRFTDRRADALSGGMYKKLALACALLHEPSVLLLDEPTNGVDPVSRRELWELLYEFVGEGMAVLVSTPYMDEAERCHRVGLINRGVLLDEGRPQELVRAFAHEAFEIEGGEREQIHALLERLPQVLASSPAGTRLRVVLERGTSQGVAAEFARAGASLRPTEPDFEDMFLVRLSQEAA
jgi:ABC-2 type transport system ATP-binding protein